MVHNKHKVLLTNPILPSEHARLAAHAEVVIAPQVDDATLRALIADCDGLIVRAKLPTDIFEFQSRLKGVVRHGVGLDMIPMEQATAQKIPVANVPGSNTASVVEYCLSAMLYSNRNIHRLVLAKSAADWSTTRAQADEMRELSGQTLGIVGVGQIGGALGGVAGALGMRVLGLSRKRMGQEAGIQFVDKDRLFSEADIVVLCCPLTPETRGMVDAETLALMKPSALLINVSRGPVIDTAALIQALGNERLAAAVLDVHDVQPIPAGMYPEIEDRLVLTPHVAGITETSMANMSRGAVDEMLRALQGERFLNLVNPEIYN